MLMNLTPNYTSSLLLVVPPFKKLPLNYRYNNGFYRLRVKCCANNSTDSKFPFKIPLQLQNYNKWFSEIDPG